MPMNLTSPLGCGSTWRELMTFALRLLGVDNQPVSVHWVPAQTIHGRFKIDKVVGGRSARGDDHRRMAG